MANMDLREMAERRALLARMMDRPIRKWWEREGDSGTYIGCSPKLTKAVFRGLPRYLRRQMHGMVYKRTRSA